MFQKFAAVAVLILTGCSPYETATQKDFEKCVNDAVQATLNDASEASEFIDKRHLASRIAKAFDVSLLLVATKEAFVKKVFSELIAKIDTSADSEFVAHSYMQTDTDIYKISGDMDSKTVEIDLSYKQNRCQIRDARIDGISITALVVGRLSSENVFSDGYEDPYEVY